MRASSSPAAAQELASAGSGDGAGFGGHPWGGQAAPLQPLLLPHMIPCACPPLPCYGWLSPPPLSRLLTPPVSPGELLLLPPPPPPGPLLCSAFLRAGPPEDPPRAKAAASRESTAALKAWLGRHPKNPYPSKGEKVLLALLSQMSLTQVSTWFANARRRLKKENRACWAPRPSKAAAGEAEGDAAEGEAEEQGAVPSSSSTTSTQPRTKPPSACSPGSPWLQAAWQGPRPPPAPSIAAQPQTPPLAPKPKIWCVAELATSPQAGRAAA